MLKTYYIKYYDTDNRVSSIEVQAYSYTDALEIAKSRTNLKTVINWEVRN